jgi:hypothetical protein
MNITGVKLTDFSTTALFALGETARLGQKSYQYAKATAATTIGLIHILLADGTAVAMTTTNSAPGTGAGAAVGVALGTMAINEYGWFQIDGVCASISAGTSCVAYTLLNSTATAGRVDDDATAGAEVINGLVVTAVPTSNLAPGLLRFPTIGRTL